VHYGEIKDQLHVPKFDFKYISRDTNLMEVFHVTCEQFKDIRTSAKR